MEIEKWYEGIFWNNGNVLYLDTGVGITKIKYSDCMITISPFHFMYILIKRNNCNQKIEHQKF